MPDPAPPHTPPNGTPFGWSVAFWQILINAVQISVVTIFLGIAGYVINGKLEDNTKQLKENGDNQVKHSAELKEEVKTGLSNVAEKTEKVEAATKAIPAATPTAIIIEQKPADAKSEPPGLVLEH